MSHIMNCFRYYLSLLVMTWIIQLNFLSDVRIILIVSLRGFKIVDKIKGVLQIMMAEDINLTIASLYGWKILTD